MPVYLLFEVNQNAADGPHLKLSSKLPVLARVVSAPDERASL
jgi:hypothetical protein